jgi:predicted aminopeptidase
MTEVSRTSLLRTAAIAFCVLSQTGCATAGYYWQAVRGQLDLLRGARPIPKVIADPSTGAELQSKLQRVMQMRDFASRSLGLPDNASYRKYKDIHRPYVVWNVFAAPEFSVRLKEWCFPFAGCVGYKGYFAKADADKLADELRAEGYDVYTGGVPAYSTLGWFDDPVLSTFIRYPEPEIARLIFHELAHQVVYAKGDTTFNESFAVAVEEEGVERWLSADGTAGQREAFELAKRRRKEYAELIVHYRSLLAELYSLGLSEAVMRARKDATLEELRKRYLELKRGWNGFAGYDARFGLELNNAQLASLAVYTQHLPAFRAVLRECNRQLPCFYGRVKQLAALGQVERQAEMQRLAPQPAEPPEA